MAYLNMRFNGQSYEEVKKKTANIHKKVHV